MHHLSVKLREGLADVRYSHIVRGDEQSERIDKGTFTGSFLGSKDDADTLRVPWALYYMSDPVVQVSRVLLVAVTDNAISQFKP